MTEEPIVTAPAIVTAAAPNPAAAPIFEYGSFTNRMMASILDLALLLIIGVPVVDFLMSLIFTPIDPTGFMEATQQLSANPPALVARLWHLGLEQHVPQRVLVQNLMQISIIALYVLPFWFRYSTTPGKMLFRLQIQDEKTALRMTRAQAVRRFLGYIVSGACCSIGFVWILLNKQRKGFHDMIAGTVVVVRPRPLV